MRIRWKRYFEVSNFSTTTIRAKCRQIHGHGRGLVFIWKYIKYQGLNESYEQRMTAKLRYPYQCEQIIDKKVTQFFIKSPKKVTTAVFTFKVTISKYFKSHQTFGLLLNDKLSPRTFKNRPIWSHWSLHIKSLLLSFSFSAFLWLAHRRHSFFCLQ